MIGTLWFDDSKKSLEDKIREATRNFEKKFGYLPIMCYTNVAHLESGEECRVIDQITIYPVQYIQKNNFFLVMQ